LPNTGPACATRSRPPVRHFTAVALSAPPRPADLVAEISFLTTYPVGDGIAPVERLSADRHAWWPRPARMPAVQRPFANAQFAGELFRGHVFGEDGASTLKPGQRRCSHIAVRCHFSRLQRTYRDAECPRMCHRSRCKNEFYSESIFARAARLIEPRISCLSPGGTVMWTSAAHSVTKRTPGP
jgi:hypothetical protein